MTRGGRPASGAGDGDGDGDGGEDGTRGDTASARPGPVFDAETAGAEFLGEIASRPGLPPGVDPAEAAEVVLCTLVQRLGVRDALDLLEALPATVRQYLRHCERPAGDEAESFGLAELERRAGARLGVPPGDGAEVARAVLAALAVELPRGVVARLARRLPEDLATVLLEAASPPAAAERARTHQTATK